MMFSDKCLTFLQLLLVFSSRGAYSNPLQNEIPSSDVLDFGTLIDYPKVDPVLLNEILDTLKMRVDEISDLIVQLEAPTDADGVLDGLRSMLSVSSSEISKLPGGVVYTRWGNSKCPDEAELIYAGTIGGSYYSDTGGGSNYLCMPSEPIYDEVDISVRSDRALLYSSEYEVNTAPTRLQSVHDQTPTCAVCRASPGRTAKAMIPARNVCPSNDWHLEYKGYLMAERYTYKRTEFICVERDMEAEPGTNGSQQGALLYMVETRCLVGGGLPCNPYINGYELSCAVCSI